MTIDTLAELLDRLTLPDYEFLSKGMSTVFSFNSDGKRKKALKAFVSNPNRTTQNELNRIIEEQICYLGSADIAYLWRKIWQKTGHIPFGDLVEDVARHYKVKHQVAPIDERLDAVVQAAVSKTLGKMKPGQVQAILMRKGASKQRVEDFMKEFLKKNGAPIGVGILVLIGKYFGREILEKVIVEVAISMIARFLGRKAAQEMFAQLAAKFPWWAEWAGPLVWIASGVWLLIDMQGPAKRKTVPFVLYLGICAMRIRSGGLGD